MSASTPANDAVDLNAIPVDERLKQWAETRRQRQYIDAVIEHGNFAKAAEALGVSRGNVWDAIKRVRIVAAREGFAPGHFEGGVAPDPITAFGLPFDVVGPTPLPAYAMQPANYQGQAGWWLMECRSGDRRTNDPTSIDRIGADGTAPLTYGVPYVFEWDEVLIQNMNPTAPGYTNIFEVHGDPDPAFPGEYEGSGPVMVDLDWSAGLAQARFRVKKQVKVEDATGKGTGNSTTLLYDRAALNHGQKYRMKIEFRLHETEGYIKFWLDGALVVNHVGEVGYGSNRRHRPQIRIYRATRPETARRLWRPV